MRGNTFRFERLEPRQLLAADPTAVTGIAAEKLSASGIESDNRFFVPFNGAIYYASDGDLWKSDGTPGGTFEVFDFAGSSTAMTFLTPVVDKLFFVGEDPTRGRELWVSDGTAAGTRPVRDIFPGSASSNPRSLRAIGDKLVFTADSPGQLGEPWISDGAEAGTRQLVDSYDGPATGEPRDYFLFRDEIFFFGYGRRQFGPAGLWKTNFAGDRLTQVAELRDELGLNTSLYTAPTHEVTFLGDLVLFRTRGFGGNEIWASDGTTQRTFQLARFLPDSAEVGMDLTRVGNQVFFYGRTAEFGRELWVTDGTVRGTRMVLDVFPGPQSGTPITRTFPGYFSLAELNGRVLFGADDGVHGVELWSSDGTADGTKMVVDALSEPGNSSLLLALTRVSDRVLFSSGGETYVTDGTAQGTVSIVSGRVIIPTQRDQRVTLGDSLIFNYQEAVYRLTPRDVVAPAIRSGHYRFNFPQPFVDVFFSEPVRGAAAFDQIRVRNVDTGTDVTDPAISLLTGLVTLQSQLDIRFPGAPRGVLPDGNYRLIIPAGALADGFRNVNHQLTFDFFVLAGDINRNRVVDNLDAGVMAHHFNTAGGFQKGDFDYSGFIDMTDFSILAQRFNLPLAPPPPARLGSSSFPFSENRLVDAVAALD